jgi:hypothetical protein
MRPVFADTFYWIALLNTEDPDHERVTAYDLSLERPPLVTTEEVLIDGATSDRHFEQEGFRALFR